MTGFGGFDKIRVIMVWGVGDDLFENLVDYSKVS